MFDIKDISIGSNSYPSLETVVSITFSGLYIDQSDVQHLANRVSDSIKARYNIGDERVESLMKTVKDHQVKDEQTTEFVKSLGHQIAQLTSSNHNQAKTIEKLQADKALLEGQLSEAGVKEAALQQRIKNLKATQFGLLYNSVKSPSLNLDFTQLELHVLAEENKKLCKAVEQNTKALAERDLALSNLSATNSALRAEISSMNGILSFNTAAIRNQQAELVAVRKERDEVVNTANRRINVLEADRNFNFVQIQSMERTIDALQAERAMVRMPKKGWFR